MDGPSRSPFTRFFLLGFLLAVLFSPGNLAFDAEKRLQVTRWIWTSEPQVRDDETQFLNRLPGRNGELMAQFGIGQSLVMLPADLASAAVFGAKLDDSHLKQREVIVYFLTFPLIAGLTLAMARRICGMFLPTLRRADLATLAFAFCTSFLVYSRDSQENILMAMCLFGGVWHGLNWSRYGGNGHAAALATFLGYLILIRISTAAVIAPFCAAFCYLSLRGWGHERRGDLVTGIFLIGGILVGFLILDRAYHWYRFGEFTHTYAHYMVEQANARGLKSNYPMGNPYWDGMWGFFLSPRKAFLLFDPLLIFLLLAAFPLARAEPVLRTLAAFSVLAIFLTASLYARSDFWSGEASWGPRHLNIAILPATLFAITLAISHLSSCSRTWLRPLFRATLAVSFVIQALSLPLFHEIEVDQLNSGYPVRYPPALRVCNLAAKATGDPGRWNLDCGNERLQALQKLPIQFTPFQIFHAIPNRSIAWFVTLAWFAIVAIFTLCIAVWVVTLSRPTPVD